MLKHNSILEVKNLHLWGRTGKTEDAFAFFWTGSGLEVNVKAHELWAIIEADYEGLEIWADILIDGELSQRFPLTKGRQKYMVFRGMDTGKPVNVKIIRDTQSMPEDSRSAFFLSGLETDGEFLPVKEHTYRFEFIGDSITSGEGCGLTNREEWIPAVFDAVRSYPYLTAKRFDAEYRVLSQSGWGLVASWDANTKHNIPDYYDKVCGTTACDRCIAAGAHTEWDFHATPVNVVFVNLGTNDSSAKNSGTWSVDEYITMFQKKAVLFLKTLREKNPESLLVWIYGMLGTDMEPYIREAVEAYCSETGDKKALYLSLPDSGPEGLGVRSHPNPCAHENVAGVIADFLTERAELWR